MAAYIITSITVLITAVAFFGGTKDSVKWAVSVEVILDTIIFTTYCCCSRRSFITNPRYPEWTKARKWASPTKERYTLWKTS